MKKFILRSIIACAACAVLFAAHACSSPEPSEQVPPPADDAEATAAKADAPTPSPFGLDSRPNNATCVAPRRPAGASSIGHVRAFPRIAFTQPVSLQQPPNDNSRWWIVEKRGMIWSFENDTNVSRFEQVLDHRSSVESRPNEAGLLGMAFHPDFPSDPRVFLSYTINSSGDLVSVVTSMEVHDDNATLDPRTETTILSVEQPFSNHNGGHIAFGPDGFLYIGFGDGGLANDPHGHGQNKETRLGSLLRIDVNSSSGAPFAVPPSNPFVGEDGLDEIYAYGLRNPWRFSFDSQTGALWLADVGQNAFEEVNLIEAGGNYGWDRKEGFSCFEAAPPCSFGVIDPVHVYNHQDGDRSITGGYVYRGSDIPGFRGSYVFGDFVSGKVWALRTGDTGLFQAEELFTSGANISSFAQDHDGEIYFLSYGDGRIRRLVAEDVPEGNFPQLLSETGCFDPADPTQPVTGNIPFDVNTPLWSDGANKQRWLAIPNGSRIQIGAGGDWTFPNGTVLSKSFALGDRLIETRLLVRHDDGGWAGYAYQWNEDQTDAVLVNGRVQVQHKGQEWTIPSRSDCMTCHTGIAGFALGPESAQLNRDMVYPSTNRLSNQVATLARIGMFQNPPLSMDEVPRLPPLDEQSAPIADRARGYLHSNCAHCHQRGGPGRSASDFRFHVSFEDMKVCETVPDAGNLGISGARIFDPGHPETSLISRRLHALNAARMPPIGSVIVDPVGTAIIDEWITTTAGCDEQ